MTPKQFHYPLFFDVKELNSLLEPYHWQCMDYAPSVGDKGNLPVVVRQSVRPTDAEARDKINIREYEFLMVQDDRFFIWKKYENGLHIRQYDLKSDDVGTSMLDEFLATGSLRIGRQDHKTRLTYHHFVTYMRKTDLPQPEPHYEQYVVVHLHGDQLTVVPMEEFNATGGDPMYVWPVLASFDASSGTLYGYGMRMGPFSLRLDILSAS